jgi:hypothetical protein
VRSLAPFRATFRASFAADFAKTSFCENHNHMVSTIKVGMG